MYADPLVSTVSTAGAKGHHSACSVATTTTLLTAAATNDTNTYADDFTLLMERASASAGGAGTSTASALAASAAAADRLVAKVPILLRQLRRKYDKERAEMAAETSDHLHSMRLAQSEAADAQAFVLHSVGALTSRLDAMEAASMAGLGLGTAPEDYQSIAAAGPQPPSLPALAAQLARLQTSLRDCQEEQQLLKAALYSDGLAAAEERQRRAVAEEQLHLRLRQAEETAEVLRTHLTEWRGVGKAVMANGQALMQFVDDNHVRHGQRRLLGLQEEVLTELAAVRRASVGTQQRIEALAKFIDEAEARRADAVAGDAALLSAAAAANARTVASYPKAGAAAEAPFPSSSSAAEEQSQHVASSAATTSLSTRLESLRAEAIRSEVLGAAAVRGAGLTGAVPPPYSAAAAEAVEKEEAYEETMRVAARQEPIVRPAAAEVGGNNTIFRPTLSGGGQGSAKAEAHSPATIAGLSRIFAAPSPSAVLSSAAHPTRGRGHAAYDEAEGDDSKFAVMHNRDRAAPLAVADSHYIDDAGGIVGTAGGGAVDANNGAQVGGGGGRSVFDSWAAASGASAGRLRSAFGIQRSAPATPLSSRSSSVAASGGGGGGGGWAAPQQQQQQRAHPHQSRPQTPLQQRQKQYRLQSPAGAAASAGHSSSSSSSSSTTTLRRRLEAFYALHNPAKAGAIPEIMAEYKGHEEELMAALEVHYGAVGFFSRAGAGVGV